MERPWGAAAGSTSSVCARVGWPRFPGFSVHLKKRSNPCRLRASLLRKATVSSFSVMSLPHANRILALCPKHFRETAALLSCLGPLLWREPSAPPGPPCSTFCLPMHFCLSSPLSAFSSLWFYLHWSYWVWSKHTAIV